MDDHITVRLTRYRPEEEAEPTFEDYEVPCHKEWVVLDGLNYIKDQLDGTLSFRWSCRMGICGSCGMTVNGEPKLTCATFLTDYAPGPVLVEPMENFGHAQRDGGLSGSRVPGETHVQCRYFRGELQLLANPVDQQ